LFVYINNAHGTATKVNDLIETKVFKEIFENHAYNLFISSTKSQIGHLQGASSAVELIATILGMNKSFIPPTINYEYPDPECDLNYTPNKAVQKEIKYALKTSMGFGGSNSAIVLKHFSNF
jgi:3-oxoacyl-[acyl-carrier-protein] synthase II